MNMKKMIVFLLALGMSASFYGCSPSDTAPTDDDKPSQSEAGNEEKDKKDEEGEKDEEQPADSKEEEPKKEEVAHEITYSNVKVYTNSIGTTYAQIMIEIENTGSEDLYLSSSKYDLEDANGKLVASGTSLSAYPQVVSPGEKGYFYEANILDNPVEGELKLLPRLDIEKAKVDNTRYAVSDVEISEDQYGYLKAMGRVENTTDEAESMVYVVVILKDANGAPIGQMMNILMEDLNPGDKIGFEASGIALPKDITKDSVASFECFAYPMQMQF